MVAQGLVLRFEALGIRVKAVENAAQPLSSMSLWTRLSKAYLPCRYGLSPGVLNSKIIPALSAKVYKILPTLSYLEP